ncbi:LOW QUALITY PROTEIN: GRAM domain-containing protein 2B-like [Geospiza fortis]|uniref:LOW QUALITY PROTEIN: GRAM domain-containing protein 2B-like n=1 Tax=Geospiza fortis TaxID=48883 RepID=A0A6I9ZCE1_GEOFO|nr:LOW QUALITY PROTEIN: GRAM domain-containing protein 2B-like [Geospiza fortis]
MPGKLRRSRREVLGEKQWRSVEERGSAQREQPKLTRSRTYESSCKDTEQAATGRQGPPSPSLLLKDIKAVVPVASISALKKANTALLVPNAISIRTVKGEKFLFVSLRQREATYQLLRSVCKRLQVRGDGWAGGLHPSIAGLLPSSLLVQDSGQSPRDSVSSEETLGKSQSALEQSTPEPNSVPESLDEPNPRSRQADDEDGEVVLLVPRWVPSAEKSGLWGGSHAVLWAWATALWSWINPQLSSLNINIIIIIYLLLMVALLLSLGYIGLRIAELEQQLSFVGAGPHLNLSPQYKRT